LNRGAGAATVNHHARSVRSFPRWLVRDRRKGDDPLAGLTGVNAARMGRVQNEPPLTPRICKELRSVAIQRNWMRVVPLVGLESSAINKGGTSCLRQTPDMGAAQSGAVASDNRRLDHDLDLVLERWDGLPAAVRAGIVALVKAHK